MKVTETIERICCQFKDLKVVEGSPKRGRDPEFMFCIHCGRQHQIHTFTDAAGSSDWEYRRVTDPWLEEVR